MPAQIVTVEDLQPILKELRELKNYIMNNQRDEWLSISQASERSSESQSTWRRRVSEKEGLVDWIRRGNPEKSGSRILINWTKYKLENL